MQNEQVKSIKSQILPAVNAQLDAMATKLASKPEEVAKIEAARANLEKLSDSFWIENRPEKDGKFTAPNVMVFIKAAAAIK